MSRQIDQPSSSYTQERRVADRPTLVPCKSCGRDNPSTHKFCGHCGASLGNESFRAQSGFVDSARDEDAEIHLPENAESEVRASSPASGTSGSSQRVFEDSITNPHELSLFRSFRPNNTSDDTEEWDSESRSHPYRVYVGAVLAVIIVVLAYMAWRSSQISHEASPAPPAPTQEAATPPSPAPANTLEGQTPRNAAPPSSPNAAGAPKNERTSTPEKATQSMAATQRSSGLPSRGNGEEELVVAQRYLDGVNGRARDSAEATQWLWKSVAKHNAQATLLLADLYLKGNGVSKNCDQARVLLDSAARKGLKGAGERLRNLQAFGCQ